MYIFDTNAKYKENFAIDPRWCHGLTKVTCKWGLTKKTTFPPFVAIQRKSGIDTYLWHLYIRGVILVLYPTMQKEVMRCPMDGFITYGPVVCKLDAGQGRLAKEAELLRRGREFAFAPWAFGSRGLHS